MTFIIVLIAIILAVWMLQAETTCRKHKTPLSTYGYDDNLYCPQCWKELKRYHYE